MPVTNKEAVSDTSAEAAGSLAGPAEPFQPEDAAEASAPVNTIPRGAFLSSIRVTEWYEKPDVSQAAPENVFPVKLDNVVLSIEDTVIIKSWLESIDNRNSIYVYGGAVFDVCDYYAVTARQISAQQWVDYVRDVLPKRNSVNAFRKLDRASIYVHYFAITAFLHFYRSQVEDFPAEDEIEENFPSPPVPPAPSIRDTPDYEEASQILRRASEHDAKAYAMLILAYECLMTPEEIRCMKRSQIQKAAGSEDVVIYIPSRKSSQFIHIRDDVLQVLTAYMATTFSAEGQKLPEEDSLFLNRSGKVLSIQYQRRIIANIQEPLLEKGKIRKCYPLSSFRKAGLNRHLSAEANVGKVAQYAGVTEKYAAYLKKYALPDMAEIPDATVRSRHTIHELIAYAKEEHKEDSMYLDSPVEIRSGNIVVSTCQNMASALSEYILLAKEGRKDLAIIPLPPQNR